MQEPTGLNSQHPICDEADVVIVGGGVIGTAIAYFLARAGLRVCLLERNDIASGTSSAAAVAALLQTKTSAAKLTLADRSLSLLDRLHEETEQGFEYEHSGSLLVAMSETEMAVVNNMVATLQSLGLDVQPVNAREAREIMPLLGDGVVGASYSPRDAIINPLSLVMLYAKAARLAGARLYPFTPVSEIEVRGSEIFAVNTPRGRIHTRTVVNATGVWASELTGSLGITVPITPLKGELLITEPMPLMLRGTLIAAKYLLSKTLLEKNADAGTPKRSVGITLAQVKRGNFVVGSTREPAGYDKRSTFAGIHEQCRQLLELTPTLADIHLIRAYAGLRPITPDGMPIIGRMPQLPGMIVASGFGGDGLALSAVTGEIVRDIILEKANMEAIRPLSVERFAMSEEST